jgi:dTMP kinase
LGFCAYHTRPGVSDEEIISPVSRAIKKITHDPHNAQLIGTKTEALLYMAQCSQVVNESIGPWINSGNIAIADRYIYSVYALCHYGRCLNWNLLKQMGDFATNALIPDVIVLTDVPAKLAFKRKLVAGKELGRKELLGAEFFEKVRQGFLSMAKEINPERWLIIDDSKLTVKQAHKLIWNFVYPKLIENGYQNGHAKI